MRKDMIKMNETIIGIYKIENKENNKVYIGSSKNIENRWKQHKSLLRCGKHHSQHLQYAWNRYGEDGFIFEIIEENISQEELFKREQYWMDKFQSYNPKNGYNISTVAGSCVMNDNYNFEEIINEEYELEHKYKILYMIENKETKEFVYKNIQNKGSINKCIFYDFIYDLYKYLLSINFDSYDEITLYNDKGTLEMKNFEGFSEDACIDCIYNFNFQKISIQGRYQEKVYFYKDHFKYYEIKEDEAENNLMKFTVYDNFDAIEYWLD